MITVQLSDKALNTILKKKMEPLLPDIHFFKRPVVLEFKNLLATKASFQKSFQKYFEEKSAKLVADQLTTKPLSLLIEGKEDSVRLKLYQTVDLCELLPGSFKTSQPMEFNYLEVTIGKSFIVHQCSLAEEKEKILGLTRVFVLVAYDTLNHLKAPKEQVVKIIAKPRKVGQMNKGQQLVSKKAANGVYYFHPKTYHYLNPTRKVESVSRKRINQAPRKHFFLRPEFERRGHWRTIKDRKTGEAKYRIWIDQTHVVISEEKLKQPSNRVVRITNI